MSPENIRQLVRSWWLAIVLGVLSIVAGVLVLAKPDHSLRAIAMIAGIFILADGIVELMMAFGRDAENRALVAVLGTLELIIGVILIRHPIAGVQATALLLGIWLIAAGAVRLVLAFDTPGERLGRLIVAALQGIFGVIIVSSPQIGFATFALLVGLSLIANGIGMILFGVLVRTLKD